MTPLTPTQQAAFDMREKAARVVKPTEQRPCSCDRCDCYNIDDYAAVCVWDSANEDAKRIRAIHLPPAEPDGVEAMKLAREALEPFVRYYEWLKKRTGKTISGRDALDSEPDDENWFHDDGGELTAGEFRAAAPALAALNAAIGRGETAEGETTKGEKL